MKKTYKRILACAAVLSMLPITAFGTQWYDEAVAYCTEKGIIYEDYDTDGLLTRGEMAKMLNKAANIGKYYYIDNPFEDLDLSVSWSDDIINLYYAGIYEGSPSADGKLEANPENVLTREQATAFIVRTYGFEDEDKELDFSDKVDISDYAIGNVSALTGKGVITGYEDNTFKPKKEVSKVEFITMIYKAEEAVGDKMPEHQLKSQITDDRLSKNIKVDVLNEEDITLKSDIRLNFIRFSEEPGALYVYNPFDFQLEKKVNGEWAVINPDKGGVEDIGYQLKADSSSERKVNLGDFFNELEDGEYRLVYSFSVNGVGIEKGTEYSAVQFSIANSKEEAA